MSQVAKQFDKTGKANGELSLNAEVFGKETNLHVLHLALLRELANARTGSANSKTRSEVRGGGKKPWKQKGTGRARAGSIRSPLWRGGGVIFGPKPRKFDINLPKKVRRLAAKTALSVACQDQKLFVADLQLNSIKTKDAVAYFEKMGVAGQKVLLLADWRLEQNANLKLSVRNLCWLKLSLPQNLSIKDVIDSDAVVLTPEALATVYERFGVAVA